MWEITIFTPAYNRAYTLERLYQSICSQTYRDFEWIIIDDGSTDQTEGLVGGFAEKDNGFDIIYKKVQNGGKHRAINLGVKLASGKLFYIVDSDDWLPADALENICRIEQSIVDEEKPNFAGVCGLRGECADQAVGASFPGDTLDITYLERKKNNIHGDKAEVYYTEVLRRHPFPEFEGENFIPESTVWNEIAADGLKLRYFNRIVYYCEYLPDGLTKQGDEKIKKNPQGYGLLLQQNIHYEQLKGLNKWLELRKYYKLTKSGRSFAEIARSLGRNPAWFWLRLAGLEVFLRLYR